MKCEFQSDFNPKVCMLAFLKERSIRFSHWNIDCEKNKDCYIRNIFNSTTKIYKVD